MYTLDRESSDKHVSLSVHSIPNLARPSFEEATKGPFKPAHKGQSFGPSWSTHWFKIVLNIPERFNKYEHVEFHWDSHSEGLVWTEDGEPVQGLTGDGERVEYVLPKSFFDGKPHTIYVEMACNAMFGVPAGDTIQPPDPNRYFQLKTADIVAPNLEARGLNIDFWILGDAAREFPTDSVEMHKALTVATKIMNTFEVGNQDSVIACRKIAQEYLGNKVDSADVYKSGTKPIVFATGHCHIDCCWLWPFAETKRKIYPYYVYNCMANNVTGKVARSWASQCELMDRYPEHRFTASSAQQYYWLETLYPKLFERVKKNIKAGKFQFIGGSWVECDTNMPSGEALVRQFVTGQRYFESRFGSRCETFWLPDTFGYSAQLPQLCRLAGMKSFLTQKLSWNNINKFPHTTFNWVALDGSQVLCHMPPAETYTSMAHFGDMKRSVSQHKSLDNDETSLLVFGHGDGGGGPTYEHIEKLRRCRGISDTVGVLPRVHMGDSVADFFHRLEERIGKGQKFATWYGELYFELHRGTYTSQSNNKKYNRRAEIFMQEIEALATMASVHDKKYTYPKKTLDHLWRLICLCQFHDCLPGSSIALAYEESDAMYAEVFKTGKKLLEDAAGVFGISFTTPENGSVPIAINPSQWPRTEVVSVADTHKTSSGGFVQASASGPGVMSFTSTPTHSVTVTESKPGVYVLENEHLTATITGGHVTSLIDRKTNREAVAPRKRANQLIIMDDKPLYWQAWDVEIYHMESRRELPEGKLVSLDHNSLRSSLLFETRISDKSWIKTSVILAAGSPYLEFACEIEWRETMKFLKAEFPVDVWNTEASYETQYGVIRRPTHANTSWDAAKFEVCCHKWADLSEHGFGVAVLNDCKYGFATLGNVMRLSLIRAPKAPDAQADMGRHTFRYAMMPHEGYVGETVVRAAREFNAPVRVGYAKNGEEAERARGKVEGFVRVEGAGGIILDTIKWVFPIDVCKCGC